MLDLEIPPTDSRLNIPMIETSEKRSAEEANMNMPEMFIRENCFVVHGESVPLGELYERFQSWLEPEDKHKWTKQSMIKSLPPDHEKGRSTRHGGEVHITNISFTEPLPGAARKPRLKVDKLGMIRLIHDEPEKREA